MTKRIRAIEWPRPTFNGRKAARIDLDCGHQVRALVDESVRLGGEWECPYCESTNSTTLKGNRSQ